MAVPKYVSKGAPKDALVLAAGRGARLDRTGTPKPLVEVGEKPLLLRVLEHLDAVGVERAVVVVGYEARKIIRRLDHHPDLGLEIEWVEHLDWHVGQGSSLMAAADRFDGPFILSMADHLFDRAHFEAIASATTGTLSILAERDLESVYDLGSAVKLRLEGARERVVGIGRDLDGADAVDAGLFRATPALFDYMRQVLRETPRAELCDAIAAMLDKHLVGTVDASEHPWHDIDTPYALVRAEMDLRDRRRVEAVRQPVGASAAAEPDYAFTTGAPTRTRLFVRRGFVEDPSQLEIIPPRSASSPIFVFTDTRVNELYGDAFVGGLEAQGYDVERVVMPEGEEAKSLSNFTHLVERVLSDGIDERSLLISLGGGVVCNVCGFLASTLYRGIGLIHVPTTLMAQCDAAISHKQGINGKHGKNLLGSYYPPMSIAVDVDVLQTLEDWRISDGLAEVVKHALGQDPAYLDELLAYEGSLRDPAFLERVVRRNIELKCELMAVDPKEHREGLVLQYGHEIGHAVEHLSGYELFHGQSIAIGMMAAAHVSRILGGCDASVVDLHREVIAKHGLPTTLPAAFSAEEILDTMRFNKKYLVEGTRMALVDRPGHLWSVEDDYAIPVADAVIREAIEAVRE